jgi:NAD(P)H-hydrate repair Nnr-like enzyme with NAD(P)H-hydrate dehydratase domain
VLLPYNNPMTPPPFVRQDDQPLYPKILYNRPVTRSGAGRLLVAGGHSGEFSLPTTIHQLATAAGVGECRVVLPDVLAKFLGGAPGTFFVPASPSGSLGTEALGRILELSEDADAVALGASLSNNSNTAILVEKLVTGLGRPIVAFDDALTATQHNPATLTDNPQALIIATMAEAFKLCGRLGVSIHIRENGGLINKLEIIRDLKAAGRCSYVIYGTEIIVAADSPSDPASPELIVTPINYRLSLVPAVFYAVLSTFWLQNPTDRRAGLATGAYVIREASTHLGSTDRPAVGDLARALDRALRRDDF